MAYLDFPELIDFINCTKTTQIAVNPEASGKNWAVHKAVHKVQSKSYPFLVVLFNSLATKGDMAIAAGRAGARCDVIAMPSTKGNRDAILELFPPGTEIYTPTSYLRSYISDEISAYLMALGEREFQRFYIHPTIEGENGTIVRRADSANEYIKFLQGRLLPSDYGAISLVLGEPGQGKTFLAKYLATQLAQKSQGTELDLIPLLITAEQWKEMSPEVLTDLPALLLNCFRYYGAHVTWLEGIEDRFLRVALKADFVVIFDGFDELILQSKGEQTPSEVLQKIQELCIDTGLRTIITSRTTFWKFCFDEGFKLRDALLDEIPLWTTKIAAFDEPQAHDYFQRFFGDGGEAEKKRGGALKIFRRLRDSASDLAGRGFVLHLVASHTANAGDQNDVRPVGNEGGLRWLVKMLCQRDERRQNLPFDKDEQFAIFRQFAVEVAKGARPDTELLVLCMEEAREFKTSSARRAAADAMVSHPILNKHAEEDYWEFSEDQTRIYLIADEIHQIFQEDGPLTDLLNQLDLSSTEIYDISLILVKLIFSGGYAEGCDSTRKFLFRCKSGKAARFAGRYILNAIEVIVPAGEEHKQRTQFLLELSGGLMSGLHLSGVVARFDFSNVVFEKCIFDEVYFVGCRFSHHTIFRLCEFLGGSSPEFCEGFGEATLDNSALDDSARKWVEDEKVRAGKSRYREMHLRADIVAVINKFVARGRIGFAKVHEPNLHRGPIARSKYRHEIVAEIKSAIIESHHISGLTEPGWHVRQEARESVQFFADNNVFEGPLLSLYEKLRKEFCE